MKINKRLRSGGSRIRGFSRAVTGFFARVAEIPHVGSILLGAFVAGILTALAGQVFVLKRVVVEDTGGFESNQVVGWAGLHGGENLLFLDLQDVVKRLEAQRWIADVRIWKVWPHTLRVRLNRRTPFALLSTSQGLVAVDSEGKRLGGVEENSPGFRLQGLALPESGTFDDPRWKEIVMLATRISSAPDLAGDRVDTVAVTPGRLEFQTSRFRMVFAAGRADEGWKTFEKFRTAYGSERLDEFQVFDLTIADRVITRPTPIKQGSPGPLTSTQG
ncbi:MAG: FtsQ-type POTRA domain-containing protein [Nitrospirae bacterium]|nr:FtsQ-type POTRA domain-containing protein [Nitrospirota bacterium]